MPTPSNSLAATPTLLPHHARLLADSGIIQEVATARGYRSITIAAELRRLGFSDVQCRVPALLIPIWNTAGDLVLYQARPDAPRILNGKPIKYETLCGSRMALDVSPLARPWLGDPNRSLFITEGARKADAAVSRGVCCIALLGVWNWRGTNEHGGKIVLPDWERIALNGRQVYLCFDSDVTIKPAVHAALVRLKGFLESKAAHVRVVYLPTGEDASKVGLDDYLAAGHTVDELLTLASVELRPVPHESVEMGEPPYRETPAGVSWLKPTRDGRMLTPLMNFTARIVADIAEDDGAEVRRAFELEAQLNQHTTRLVIPATRFAAMDWVLEHLGAGAFVYPGFGLKDHARAAIQSLSGPVSERRVYGHTGWRQLGSIWAYLHAGGAIGPHGAIPDIEVRLPDALANFLLPDPPHGAALHEAIRVSLDMLEVAPDRMTMPIYATIYRGAITTADFGCHVSGPTGSGKTCLVGLAQQHFGSRLDHRHLPGSWASTGNALEGLTFAAKDALLVIDDFAPGGTPADVQRLHRDADRVLRAQGNHAGRLRMRADSSLRPHKPPRGLILSTGEDIPRGQSLQARLLVLELSPEEMNWERLTACQVDAASGLYAQALAGFVRWLAQGYNEKCRRFRNEVVELRSQAILKSHHRRTPEIVANLAVGFRYFLSFAQEVGALTSAETQAIWERCWAALGQATAAQACHYSSAEPTQRFLELLCSAIGSGRAHVAGPDGAEPVASEAWGWRQAPGTVGVYEEQARRPCGERVGWVDGVDVYLDPDAAYAAAQRLARDGGEALPVSLSVLKRRLRERGLLTSVDQDREVLTIRRTLEGKRRNVLHLHVDALLSGPLSAGQPDQPDQRGEGKGACQVPQIPNPIIDGSKAGSPTIETHETGEGCAKTVGLVGLVHHEEGTFLAEADALQSGPEETTAATSPTKVHQCFLCGGRRFWQSLDGSAICGQCHPPAASGEVVWLGDDRHDENL